jgi:hypothetical protein
MKCEECELLLAQDDFDRAIEAHLEECPNCRSLRPELQANAHALRALGEQVMPSVRLPERGLPWWKWISAAAAVIITLLAAWFESRPVKPPHMVSVAVNVTGIIRKETTVPYVKAEIPTTLTPSTVPVLRAANTEPLLVKMLTPDPDVVIYWLIDSEGE